MSQPSRSERDSSPQADPIELVREALDGLAYGQVVITVHAGVISQVERTEKLRPTKR
jgi:hypothetical protein